MLVSFYFINTPRPPLFFLAFVSAVIEMVVELDRTVGGGENLNSMQMG